MSWRESDEYKLWQEDRDEGLPPIDPIVSPPLPRAKPAEWCASCRTYVGGPFHHPHKENHA